MVLVHCFGKIIEQILFVNFKIANPSLNLITPLKRRETLLLTLIPNVYKLASEIFNMLLMSIHLVIIDSPGCFISLQHLFLRLFACLRIKHAHLLLLLITREYVLQEHSLPLIEYILLSLLTCHVILHFGVFEVSILLVEPFFLKIKMILFSFIGCFCSFMSINCFLKLFFSSMFINFKFSDSCLHLLHLSFFFSLQKLGLELSTWTFMLHLFN